MATTKKELVDELEKLPVSKMRDRIIQRAKHDIYHCFRSPLVAPKMTLVNDLNDADLKDLAKRVMDGEFDERPGE